MSAKDNSIIFNEAEANYNEDAQEPTIEETVRFQLKPLRKKKKGQREEDLKDIPQEEITHDVPRKELAGAFGEGNFKKGLNYSLIQEEYLKVFLTDGEAPIDDSACERALRNFTIGRKNWMIVNTIRGGPG